MAAATHRWNPVTEAVRGDARRCARAFLGVLSGALCALPCMAVEPVALLFNERPPYQILTADGVLYGLTATPAIQAFKAAGIPMALKKIPTNRQIAVVKEATGRDCAIGWFKNPEREQFAKFTRPIYYDKPTVLLAGRHFAAARNETLKSLLSRKDVHVLVKDRFSYGPYIDGLLTALKPPTVSTTNENIQMVEMIKANRADFMFAAEEEAQYLIEQAGFDPADFRVIRLADMPAGERRHIMCSKLVEDDVISRLNAVIAPE